MVLLVCIPFSLVRTQTQTFNPRIGRFFSYTSFSVSWRYLSDPYHFANSGMILSRFVPFPLVIKYFPLTGSPLRCRVSLGRQMSHATTYNSEPFKKMCAYCITVYVYRSFTRDLRCCRFDTPLSKGVAYFIDAWLVLEVRQVARRSSKPFEPSWENVNLTVSRP